VFLIWVHALYLFWGDDKFIIGIKVSEAFVYLYIKGL
jgi:hypothetical protein